MKNTGSNLTTAAGLVILLLLLFAAAYLRIPALEGFLIVLLLLCLAAWMWAKYALSRISFSIKEREIRLFPGQDSLVHFELHNGKFLPILWLGIDCRGSAPQILETANGRGLTAALTFIMPHQSLFWEDSITALTRGICHINNVRLQSGDGFGLAGRTKEIQLDDPLRIVVYPRIIPVDTGQVLRHMRELQSSSRGLYKDRTLLKNTGIYTGRENSRDINWRLLAKGGEEQVNIYETLSMCRAAFIPDLSSFVWKETKTENGQETIVRHLHTEEFEKMLSMIASLIIGLEYAQVAFSIVLPRTGSTPAKVSIPENTSLQVPELLELLAQINYHCEDTMVPYDIVQESFHQLGQIFIVSRSLEDQTVFLPDDMGAIVLTCSNETGYSAAEPQADT